MIVDAIPLNPDLPCYPFTGMVFNLSVSTSAHRDTMDLSACAVLALGSWEGGQLCLYELDDKVEEIKVLGKQLVSICA